MNCELPTRSIDTRQPKPLRRLLVSLSAIVSLMISFGESQVLHASEHAVKEPGLKQNELTTEAEPAPQANGELIERRVETRDGVTTVTETRVDSIRIPINHDTETSSLDMPSKGLSKGQVRSQYGDPYGMSGPVGEPPIFRWTYEGFEVVFEGDFVIHTLAKD